MPFVLIYALFALSNYNCKFSLGVCCARTHVVSTNANTVTFFLAPPIHFFHMKSEVFSIFLMPHSSSIFFSSSLSHLSLSVSPHFVFIASCAVFFICFHNDLLRNLSQNGAAPTCLHRNTLRPVHQHTHTYDHSAKPKAKNTSKIVLTITNGFWFWFDSWCVDIEPYDGCGSKANRVEI